MRPSRPKGKSVNDQSVSDEDDPYNAPVLSSKRRRGAQRSSTNLQALARLYNIGGAYINPFGVKRREDDNPLFRGIMHESISITWTKVVPYQESDGKYQIIPICLEQISCSDASYYGYLYSGILLSSFARMGTEGLKNPSPSWLAIKGKALHHLRIEIAELSTNFVSDQILGVILCLAFHDPNPDALDVQPLKYPTSPLSTFQSLDCIGYRKADLSHIEFLYRVVTERGGIKAIETLTTQKVVALADLFVSTLFMRAPVFECTWTPDQKILKGLLPQSEPVLAMSSTFGSEFTYMSASSLDNIKPFVDLIPALKNVTGAAESFRRRASGRPRPGALVNTANWLHYQILCLQHETSIDETAAIRGNADEGQFRTTHGLPTPSKIPFPVESYERGRGISPSQATSFVPPSRLAVQLLEIIRVTTLIYSDLVIFPVSYSQGNRFATAQQLYKLLKDTSTYVIPEPRLEMWILCMGSIACLRDHLSSEAGLWLTEKLKKMIASICGREEVRSIFTDIMVGFLWYDHVFTAYLVDLWKHMYPPVKNAR